VVDSDLERRIPLRDGFVSAVRMTRWMLAVLKQGIRRPGSPADRWTEHWLVERFTDIGLDDIRLEPVELPYWEPHRAELRVGDQVFTGFPLPHAASGVVDADLALDSGDVSGRIAVSELKFLCIPQGPFRDIVTGDYDPPNDFNTLDHILPFGPDFQHVMEPALEGGASAFVGLLTGLSWDTCDYYVPYDGEARPIPGIWLSKSDGRRLLELMRGGRRRAQLIVEAERYPTTCHNVIGTLRGSSDEWVIVASHHDAPWASAVEDATGIAQVLAQAAHWASLPVEKRPHNMLFMLTAGHMAGAAGTRAFIERHADLLDQVVLQVHVEHLARRCLGDGTKLIPIDEPEVRWWFTSRHPRLEKVLGKALMNNDLRRSLILRPDTFGPMPTTDGAYFHPAGVPLVHFLSAPMYLFDSCDTFDKVHLPSLEPVCRALAEVIAWTGNSTAASMRAGVLP
jgi:hypothetical protein